MVTPITPANAKALAAKSHEARRQNKIAMLSRLSELEQLSKQPVVSAIAPAIAEDEFRNTAMLRVREHVVRLQQKLDEALDDSDFKAIRDLAESLKKLEEVEQRLSNRPLPGTLKPTQPKQRRQSDFAAPTPAD